MKWFLFDAYGTLLNAGKENIPELSAQISCRYKISQQAIYNEWSSRYFALEANFSNDFMTIMQANRISLSYAFGKLQLPVTDVEGWMKQLIHLWSHPKLYDGVRDLINDIANNMPDSKIGVISNTDEDTISAALEEADLPISYMMSSERANCYKPDPLIFQKALAELGVGHSDCIYIGNSIGDIEGATKAGIQSIYLNRDRKPLPSKYRSVPIFDGTDALRTYFRDHYFAANIP